MTFAMSLFLLLFSPARAADAMVTATPPIYQRYPDIPVAAYQRYLSKGVDTAISGMNFTGLNGKQVLLDVSGVIPMSDQDLFKYLSDGVSAKIALDGGRVTDIGQDARVLLRVAEAGLDEVLVTRKRKVRGQPLHDLAWAGAGVAGVLAGLWIAVEGDDELGLALTGASVVPLTIGVSRAIRRRVPKTMESYRVRVDMTATIVSTDGPVWTTHGVADLSVDYSKGGAPTLQQAESRPSVAAQGNPAPAPTVSSQLSTTSPAPESAPQAQADPSQEHLRLTVTRIEATDRIERLYGKVGRKAGIILLGAAGQEAEAFGRGFVNDHPGVPVSVTRVPTLGDSAAEMRGAMARQGSSCAVRVNKESGDIWGLEFFGCTP